jgi:TatA/E family protein of Tat protein translocase
MGFGIQPIHIVVVVIVALLIFGPKRLPEMGRSIGKAINEFRHGTRDITESLRAEINPMVEPHNFGEEAPENATIQPPAGATPFHMPVNAPGQAGNYCIQCGASNPVEAHFCSNCGTKLVEKVERSTGGAG